MKKYTAYLFTLISLFMSHTLIAQNLKQLTLDDVMPGGETYRYAENIYGLNWWGDKLIAPSQDSLQIVQTKDGTRQVLVTRKTINHMLTKGNCKELSHLYNCSFPWEKTTQILIDAPQQNIVLNFETGEVIHCFDKPVGIANEDFCPQNFKTAYTLGNNLYVDNKQITNEPDGVVCGQSVHRNEFGIMKGTFWSPDGKFLAFYRMDQSMVAQYPLTNNTSSPIAKLTPIYYPMAGQTSQRVTIGIYQVETGETTFLELGDTTDRYFCCITWAPNGQNLYLTELNRDQNHAKLCRYNASNGKLEKILFEESHNKYVEPQHDLVFLPWNENQFIYQTRKDGFNHLYLYDTEGKFLGQLTKGEYEVKDLIGFTPKKEIIVLANKANLLQTNIYKVNPRNTRMTSIDNTQGWHSASISANGLFLIDRYSTPNEVRHIELLNLRNDKRLSLLNAESPYKGYVMPQIETGTIKAADGKTDLFYRIMKPSDFDPSKIYPVIVYVYGGPHAHLVNHSFLYGARAWDIYMANQGYIMFSLDNRGSENRGLDFENATFRKLGIEECKDQVEGIKYLKAQPWVDATRIGVHGWSFGGHMTTALMLRYPELFKVGVAGGPVMNWALYEVMYGERYMDTPQANPEGYDATNLTRFANQLKGNLLIVHDDNDDTCVPQHTWSFIKACVDARTYPDLFMYPGHKHNVLGRDRVHLYEKITRYFQEKL